MSKELDSFILDLGAVESTDKRTDAELTEEFGLKVAEEALPCWPLAAMGNAGAKKEKKPVKDNGKPDAA